MIPGVAQQRCRLAEGEIAYYRAGQGTPVVLVHGITTYSFIWRNLFADLARGHDVVALDLLGCGQSDMPLDVSYALRDHARYLQAFVTALGLPRFHLVGHDLGGGIAQIFAVEHPDRLLDLALVNTVGYDFWPVQPITVMRTPIVRQMLMATLDKGMFRLIVKRGIHNSERVTTELMDLFLAPFKSRAGRQAFLHFARCLDNHDLTSITAPLRSLPLPVLVLRGQEDQYLGAGIAAKLQREIPDCRLVLLPDAGHFCQEDVPALLVSELTAFCEDYDA